MRTWTEQRGLVPESDLELLQKVRIIIEKLPDFDWAVSCHVICRAIARSIPQLEFRDGDFIGAGWLHSWLLTPEGNVIDAYPWATVGGPTLLCCKFFSPWPHAFKVRPVHLRDDELVGLEEVTRWVAEIVRAGGLN